MLFSHYVHKSHNNPAGKAAHLIMIKTQTATRASNGSCIWWNNLYLGISVTRVSLGVFVTFLGILMEFYLNGTELSLNSGNSGNLKNHWSINWAQFKDPVSVVASISVKTFSENSNFVNSVISYNPAYYQLLSAYSLRSDSILDQ